MKSIELFAGAGGLALGVSKAGFKHEAVIEWDRSACDTMRDNKKRRISPIARWPIHQTDIRSFDFTPFCEKLDLLTGGPPCQPFSIGGKHRGFRDSRNMFPELVRSVREVKPRVVLIENVRGLLRSSFSKYFEYILLQLTYPDVVVKDDERWECHLVRLERYHTRGKPSGLHYRVVFQCLNAAEYGIPQRRNRVFIVAFRSDVRTEWSFPEPTHSHEALVHSKWVTGDYWNHHGISKRNQPPVPPGLKQSIRQLALIDTIPLEKPFLTVRDAISDLPDPRSKSAREISNHRFMDGARSYPGHTGSPLDEPAKTLKAGDHGVPGGENMLVYPDGKVRYFTVRESARLQTFPDKYTFSSASWSETMRQLGNAVPVKLAHLVAKQIHKSLKVA